MILLLVPLRLLRSLPHLVRVLLIVFVVHLPCPQWNLFDQIG